MRRQARSKWPTRLAIFAAIGGAILGWWLVRREVAVWESGGYTAGPEFGLVIFLAVAFAVAAFFVARRFLDGPGLTRTGWSLTFQGPVTAHVAALGQRLSQRGYTIEVCELDDAAEPVRVAAASTPIAGTQLGIALPDEKTRARVILRLSAAPAAGDSGLGLVESEDTSAGFYDELGQYLIAELAGLVPGISYKRSDSALDPEPTESLRAILPARPSRLDGK